MSNEEFVTYAEKYMDAIYRIAYSWTKNPDDANGEFEIFMMYQKKNAIIEFRQIAVWG